jgi:hypothetical protein
MITVTTAPNLDISDIVKTYKYSTQRHSIMDHCDRYLFIISSKFLLYLECFLISPKKHKKVKINILNRAKDISFTKKSDTSITDTVIYHRTKDITFP